MPRGPGRPLRRLLLLAAVLVLAASPAAAHRLMVFATAQGAVVDGYAYLSDGSRPAGAAITVEAGGTVTTHLTTDADGGFRFTAERRLDHRIVATLDGHQGEWTVHAAELPAALPAGPAATAPPTTVAAPRPNGDLEAVVERAVARQTAPLRAELQTWRAEARWHDVAGGLGWIVGLAGLAAWAQARRKP
jgi:nickel transport protein